MHLHVLSRAIFTICGSYLCIFLFFLISYGRCARENWSAQRPTVAGHKFPTPQTPMNTDAKIAMQAV